MSKIVKNNTGLDIRIVDTGITVPGSGQYVIPPQDYLIWAASDNIVTEIDATNIIVNDGNRDLPSVLGKAHLRDGIAEAIAFDNSANGFPVGATNVQRAIESVLAFDPQSSTAALFDDFLNSMTWSPSTSGAGSSASVGGGNATFASGKHAGVAQLQYGTLGLPTHASLVQSATLATSTVFGEGVAEYQTLIIIPVLATALEDYTFRCGFGTSINADHADGIYFEYNRSLSLNWRLKTASNSIRTAVNSTIAVTANNWIHLRWVVNSTGTNVDFYINGTLAGSITTNIPTVTGRGSGPNFQLVASALLTGGNIVLMDYFYFIKYFTARN